MFFNAAVFSVLFAAIGLGIAAPASVYNGDGRSPLELALLGVNHDSIATFYETGLGACGQVNHDTDHIAAVSHQFFDSFE